MNHESKLLNAARWVWSRSSALVALLLILTAFAIGYRVATPASHTPGIPEAKTHAHETHADASDATKASVQYYTCSMHPSVRLTDPDAKCPICHMDLIPVGSGATPGDEHQIKLTTHQSALSRIETTRVERRFPTATERLYGKIGYDQTTVARISAYFPGRIEKLYVNFAGVPVQQTDHLAEIYSPELIGAFEELHQAALTADRERQGSAFSRETAMQTLAAARDKLRLFGIDRAQIELIEREGFDRDVFTIRTPIGGVVTHIDVREGDYLTTGQPIATVADLNHLWLDLQAYESQLASIRWGQRVRFTVESHPGESFAGRVSFIEPLIDPQTRTAAVRVAVENEHQRLKPGMFASAVIETRMGQTGAVIEGDLAGEWVCPMHPTFVRGEPGACAICAMDLVPAESMGGASNANTGDQAPLVIPVTAVLFTGTRSVVYVAQPSDDDGVSYEARQVTLGPRAGDFYIVREGLDEGERVVSHGAFRIDSAMQIGAKPSMMTAHETDEQDDDSGSGSNSFTSRLSPVYDAYLGAQSALALDDLEGYNRQAQAMAQAVARVQVANMSGDDLAFWTRDRALLEHPGPAPDLETARDRFREMSESILGLARRFGHAQDDAWSVVHCPMAFDFEGADWVQTGTEVRNPYFGASMLRCGSITSTLAPTGKAGDHE